MKCNISIYNFKTILMLSLLCVVLSACDNQRFAMDNSFGKKAESSQTEEMNAMHTSDNLGLVSEDTDSRVNQETVPSDFESSTLSQIKEAVGFPFRLWNSQNQQLHCISIFDSYAKREVDKKTESGYEKYDNLKWSITENTLSITGSWNEDFVIDMTTKTAVSMLDGTVYDIVPGKMLDGQYVE